MSNQAFLRAFVVVRRNYENGVSADFLCVLGKLDGIRRLVRARAGNDRDTALDRVDSAFDGCFMLFIRHRGRFTARARDDDSVRAALDLVLNDTAEFFEVDTVFRERRDDGNACTLENCLFHQKSLLSYNP